MKKNKIFVSLLSLLLLAGCSKGGESASSFDSGEQTSQTDTNKLLGLDELPNTLNDNVIIRYHRDDKAYENWALWLWADGKDGAEYLPNYYEGNEVVFAYPLSTFSTTNTFNIGIIVKSKGSWSSKDVESDRFISSSEFEKDSKGNINVYVYSGIEKMYSSKQDSFFDVADASFLNFKKLNVLCYDGNAKSYKLYKNGELIKQETFEKAKHEFQISFEENILLKDLYHVKITSEDNEEAEKDVSISKLYESDEFASLYNYDGELGAIYTSEKTTFRVWSPLSSKIILRIYDSGTPTSISLEKGNDHFVQYEMTSIEKGVFEYVASGDLGGKYYTYVVTNNYYKDKEVVDPYAKSTGISSKRGMIVDFSKTDIEGWDSFSKAQTIDRKALTVYETHVADVTSSSTWTGSEKNRKKFLGLCEEGTTYTSNNSTVKTGFDHIKELGVNAVQLLPIFDQANDETSLTFNWGYNPQCYNALEGSYSSDPYDGYSRIKEFKKVVLEYQKAGINIIMDVVYNHTNSVTGESFDVLCPYYYFRYSSNVLSNGSGCGNETASNHYMFSKFMKDSTAFWLEEYKLGGFRFDLMGLHDITTMNELVANLKTINEGVVVYGEPWTGGTSPLADEKKAKQSNANKFVGYGQFNDQLRDGLIKSGMKGDSEAGYITGNVISSSEIKPVIEGIKGQTSNATLDPDKTVNYVTCHDNYTIYDRITAYDKANENTVGYTKNSDETKMKMNMLANSIVFSSQGTSFMLAGEEMLRSKGEDLSIAKNSYNSSYEVNQLDYANLIKYPSMMNVYKKLISLKQSFSSLHLSQEEASKITVNTSENNNLISYSLSDSEKEYVFYFNNGYKKESNIDLSDYTLYLDSLNENKTLSSTTELETYEVLIAYKNK